MIANMYFTLTSYNKGCLPISCNSCQECDQIAFFLTSRSEIEASAFLIASQRRLHRRRATVAVIRGGTVTYSQLMLYSGYFRKKFRKPNRSTMYDEEVDDIREKVTKRDRPVQGCPDTNRSRSRYGPRHDCPVA
ncbi:hypothetical protein J6590_020161 [Homalodisca vitripennis]|nr:hypothetical protein J6590_020161 [Homalodisca vitripennis]